MKIDMDKFTVDSASSYDYMIYKRWFSGPMNPDRVEKLRRMCKEFNSVKIERCHHEHDCCGCLCSQHMEFFYHQNQVVITISLSYNY